MIKRPTCCKEGCKAGAKQKGRKPDGSYKYGKYCSPHDDLMYGRLKYRLHKKDKCSFCGFVPVHPCQLDVDHIDNNHKNNDPSNLQTLCANCHRLKTHVNRQPA